MQKTTTLKKFKVLMLKSVLSMLVLCMSFQVGFAQKGKAFGQKQNSATEASSVKSAKLPVFQEKQKLATEASTPLTSKEQYSISQQPTDMPSVNKAIAEGRRAVVTPPTPNGVSTTFTYNGTLDVNDDKLTVSRPFRDGVSSACGTIKTCTAPTVFGNPFYYDTYSFTNTSSSPVCITVTYALTGPGTGDVFSVAYLGSFDPNNLCANFLADGGSSAVGGPITYGVTAPAGATIIFLANAVTAGTVTPNYTLSLEVGSLNACIAPELPIVTGNLTPCPGASTTLSVVGGDLNSATAWKWYTGSCGGTLVGTGNSITVTPTGTTTYYVRGEGACVTPGTCKTVVVTPSAASSAAVLSQTTYPGPLVNVINEGFNTFVAFPGSGLPAGWSAQFLSQPLGVITVWYSGMNTTVLTPHSGADYIAANYNHAGAALGTLSTWMFAPSVTLKNGDKFSFWTAHDPGNARPDRLQVRMNKINNGTNVGASATSVGDFTDLLLDINPTYSPTGYPTAWTQFTVTLSGLPAAGTPGRIAFRYFCENSGGVGVGTNSDYIGIDDVLYQTPTAITPTTCVGSSANLKVDITGGLAPYTVVINATPATAGYPRTITGYNSGDNIAVNPIVTTTYNLVSVTTANGCVGTGNSGTPTVTVSPTVTPGLVITANPSTPICAGDPTLLTVLNAPLAGTVTASSGAINVAIPDGNAVGVETGVTIAGVPAGATLTAISTTFNINHTWDGDLSIYLKSPAPGNKVINLAYQIGSLNDNFTNTVLTSVGTPPNISTGAAPFTGTYAPHGNAGPQFPTINGGYAQTDATFASLMTSVGANLNGTWLLGVRDAVGSDVGFITNFAVTLNYAIPGGTPVGYTFQWTPTAGLSSGTGNPVAASPTSTRTYTVLGTAPSGCQTTASYTVVVNQLPAITASPASVTACANTSVSFTGAGSGAGITYQWQVSPTGVGGPWTNIANGAPYSGATTVTLTVNPVTPAMSGYAYRLVVSGTCSPAANSAAAVLTVNNLPVVAITPASPVCGGVAGIYGTLLTAGSLAPPIPGTLSVTSGAISVPIPDNSPAGATHTINVSTLPTNATITGIKVKWTMPHTWNGDMVFALKAPGASSNILNLDYYLSGTGGTGATTGFVNTQISSAGGPALSTGSGTYTGTFKADGTITGAGGSGGPTGFTPTTNSFATLIGNIPSNPNGAYTLAMYDGGAGDVGTLTTWTIDFDYNTPGPAGPPLVYTWAPAAGLYSNANATTGYVAGTQTPQVYAAPTVNTVYTITATNTSTTCVNTGTVLVNYTPPAPAINPASVITCQGAPATKLTILSSLQPAPFTYTNTNSTPVPIVDNNIAGATSTINIPVGAVPATAQITSAIVTINATHTWVGDMNFSLKAPNNKILNLDYLLNTTGGAGATTGFTNTRISSLGTTRLDAGTNPFNAVFAADKVTVPFNATLPVAATSLATAGTSITGLWSDLYPSGTGANLPGNWVLGFYDGGPPDAGTLNSWSITFNYLYGPPADGIWSPVTGLSNDSLGTSPYVAGTPANSVWARPATTTTYSVTIANGTCTSPATTVLVTVRDTVKIITAPVNASICANTPAKFTVVATGNTLTYQWETSVPAGPWTPVTNDAIYSGATTATLTITNPPLSFNGRLYRVKVSGACGFKYAPDAITNAGVILTVPSVSLTVPSGVTKLFPGGTRNSTTTLVANVSPTPVRYDWFRNGTFVTSTVHPNNKLDVNVDQLGDYTVMSYDATTGGCGNLSNLISITDSISGNVFIYPNPSNGQFEVRYHSALNNVLPRGLNIYDDKGARIVMNNYTNTAPYSRMVVDLSRYGKGVYWVEVVDRNGNRLAMGRVVVL